jgi:hypothetical protein
MLTHTNQHCHHAVDLHSMRSQAPPRGMSGGSGVPNARPLGSVIRSYTGGAGHINHVAYHENASQAPNHQMPIHANHTGHQTGHRMMARSTPHATPLPRRHSMSSRSTPVDAHAPNSSSQSSPVVSTEAVETVVPSRPQAVRSKSTRI